MFTILIQARETVRLTARVSIPEVVRKDANDY